MKHYIQNPTYSTTQATPGAITRPISLGFINDGMNFVSTAVQHGKDANEAMINSIPKSNNPLDSYMPPEQVGRGKRTYGTPIVSDDMSGLAPAPQSVPTSYIHDPGATRAPQGDYHNWQNTELGRNVRGIR